MMIVLVLKHCIQAFLALVLLGSTFLNFGSAEIVLSHYLGAPSGTSTGTSNPPYTNIVSVSAFDFGVDVPGNFAFNLIEFIDDGPFENGIGAHSDSVIEFSLDELREIETFTTFTATLGIDVPSLIQAGIDPASSSDVTFRVYLDNKLVSSGRFLMAEAR